VTALRQRMLEDLQIRHYSQQPFAYTCTPSPSCAPLPQTARPTWSQTVCALRLFYTHSLNQKIAIERIPFPRRERKLPTTHRRKFERRKRKTP
jgi:hypothetical protein